MAAWIDGQRAKQQLGIFTWSARKRAYRRVIIGNRLEVRLVFLRGSRDLIAQRLADATIISCRQVYRKVR